MNTTFGSLAWRRTSCILVGMLICDPDLASAGAADYEQLAHNVGGRWLRLWSEVWVVVLLVGTNIG